MNEEKRKEKNGFVPVQYKMLKLDAEDIISAGTRIEKREKGTGQVCYYSMPSKTLFEWLTTYNRKSGLVAVGDNILFQKLREIHAAQNSNEDMGGLTPNQQQKEACNQLKTFRESIKRLKVEINGNAKATVKIKKLNDTILQMEEFLFVADVINVHSSSKSNYDKFSKKGFYYGDNKYVRLCAGSGNLKQNTVTFIREDMLKEVLKKIRVGFLYDIETTEILPPSKFGAYEGLTLSGCTFIHKPRVVVIPDFEQITFRDKNNKDHCVFYVTKTKEWDGGGGKKQAEYDIDIVPFYETKEGGAYLNSFDGMGLIEPDFVKSALMDDLMIDYIPSAFVVRSIGVKGLLATFPFRDFAKAKGFTKILDIRYKDRKADENCYVNIDDVDIILTESQWKYKKLYNSLDGRVGYNFDEYNNNKEALWGIQRYTPRTDKNVSRLNYQLTQTSNIRTDEDVKRLVEPTIKHLRFLAEGKPEYVLYTMSKGVKLLKEADDEDKDIENGEENDVEYYDYDEINTTTLIEAIMKNPDLLNDDYVNGEIKKYIKSILDKAKYGKLYPEGNSNYQFMISDPYALAQWALNWFDWMANGIPDINKVGIIPAKHIYSQYWNKRSVSTVDACRSPMTDIAEHNILTVCSKDNCPTDFDEMDKWFKYLESGIVYSIYDLSTVIHSDSDWDGDIVLTTDSETLINNAWDTYPTTYDKGCKPQSEETNKKNPEDPQKYNLDEAVASDKRGFGNKVGTYSNYGTCLFAMLPMFEDGEKHNDSKFKACKEYEHLTAPQLEIIKAIKKNRYIIGEEIDSTKTGRKPVLSSDFMWAKIPANEVMDCNQKEIEEVAKNYIESTLLKPKNKPYFFVYVRQNYKDLYNEFKKSMNDACKWLTYKPLDRFLKDKTLLKTEFANDDEKAFWDYYYSHSPLLLTDCITNKVCWELERFEEELNAIISEKWKNKNRYVLFEYADDNILVSRNQKKFIEDLYDRYRREIQTIFSKKKTEDGEKALYRIGLKEALLYSTKVELLETLKVGYANIFSMLVKVLKNKNGVTKQALNSFIWNIMGDSIIEVIPEVSKRLVWKPSEDGSGVDILGEKIVFEWKERING